VDDAEARAQRRRQEPGPRRRADEREPLEGDLDGPGARPLSDDDVQLVVFHRRIEDLFDRRAHAVHFVDEDDLPRLEGREHRREVAGLLNHGAGRRPDRDAELVRNDARQGRLSQTRRAVEEHVVQRFTALLRRGNRDVQVLAHPLLSDVLVERPRAEAGLVLRVFVDAHGGYEAIL
jgi:hypothetical protein